MASTYFNFGIGESILNGTVKNEIAKRYATALYDVANNNNCLDDIESDLSDIADTIIENEDVFSILESPIINKNIKTNIMALISKKMNIHDITHNFITLLAKRNRLIVLHDIILAYKQLAKNCRGEIDGILTSAQKLTDEQTSNLISYLETKLNKTVHLESYIDPTLIGGFIVKIGSQMIDASISNQLKQMHIAVENT